MTKILFALLSSYNIKCLKMCYQSIKNQNKTNLNYSIIIVINTLNDNYFLDVKNTFKDCEIIRTESNGCPGKGKNSLINLYKERKEFDYLIPLDGDDILYPCALNRLEIYMQYNPDILMLPYTDLISRDYPNLVQHVGINNKLFLRFNNDLDMRTQWYNDKKSCFEFNINNANTPARLFLVSRKALDLNLYYDENMKWYDDFITFLQIFEACIIHKSYNIFMLDDKDIYLYNRINDESASDRYKIDNEKKKINEEINFRKSIYNRYLTIRDWNLKTIPFITADVNLKFKILDKVKFVENIIKYLDLENIIIDKSNYNRFLNNAKVKKNKDIEELFKKLLN
jgi:hypothetical protein